MHGQCPYHSDCHYAVNFRSFWEMMSLGIGGGKCQLPPYGMLVRPLSPQPPPSNPGLQRTGISVSAVSNTFDIVTLARKASCGSSIMSFSFSNVFGGRCRHPQGYSLPGKPTDNPSFAQRRQIHLPSTPYSYHIPPTTTTTCLPPRISFPS